MDAPAPRLGETFLLEQFRAFYAEIVDLKGRARTGEWAFAGEDSRTAEGTPIAGATAISQRLLSHLENGAIEAARRGGAYGTALYREAQYVMAAVADEIFLHDLEWDGKSAWKDNLLETRLFRTYVAGERFFTKLEEVLESRDPVFAELGAVYLMALTLGFRGRYRDTDDGGRLEAYRRQLFYFVTRRQPGSEASTHMFAEAYGHRLDEGQARKLPHIRRWIALLVLFFAGYLLVSHALWRDLTADIAATVSRIL